MFLDFHFVVIYILKGCSKEKMGTEMISQPAQQRNKFLSFNLDYSRVEIGSVTRRRRVKLWSSTANPPQRSKWAEIGSPLGDKCRYKMNIINHILKKKVFFEKYSNFMIINC